MARAIPFNSTKFFTLISCFSSSLLRLFAAFVLNFPTFISSCGLGFMGTRAPIRRLVSSSELLTMSKPAGKCVFCGKPGLTHGHIWPLWIQKILPAKPTHSEFRMGELFTVDLPEGAEKYTRREEGPAGVRKPRNTCRTCNSSWMSQIENAAKVPLTNLIKGDDILLNVAQQRAVASLLCLISMRYEFMGNMRSIPASDRMFIKKDRIPPPEWIIWIAKYTGNRADDHWARYMGMVAEDLRALAPQPKYGPDHCNTQVTTLVIGKICAHLFSSTVMPHPGFRGGSLARLWPLTGYNLRSEFLPGIPDTGVISLHEALVRGSPRRSLRR
jgi:hypothetical protein